jgi:hypothetical protein
MLATYTMFFIFAVVKVNKTKIAEKFFNEMNGLVFSAFAYVNIAFAFCYFFLYDLQISQ